MACKIEHASVEYRPESNRSWFDLRKLILLSRTILSFIENLREDGGGYDDAILLHWISLTADIFRGNNNAPMLPRKKQLHKQPMEKGCLQRKLHFHGSMYYA